jgi:hypothetical protein
MNQLAVVSWVPWDDPHGIDQDKENARYRNDPGLPSPDGLR